MSLVLDHPHLVDTLRYKLFVHRRVVQDDIRVSVQVDMLVAAHEHGPQSHEARIREALRSFIDADWVLAQVQRRRDTVGYERISVAGGAQVSAQENYNLVERARLASRDGLALVKPGVTYALSRSRLDAIVAELMAEALVKANAQAKAFGEASARTWRIGDIAFGVSEAGSTTSARTSKGAYRADELGELLAGIGDDDGDLVGSEHIWLVADVTLKAAP